MKKSRNIDFWNLLVDFHLFFSIFWSKKGLCLLDFSPCWTTPCFFPIQTCCVAFYWWNTPGWDMSYRWGIVTVKTSRSPGFKLLRLDVNNCCFINESSTIVWFEMLLFFAFRLLSWGVATANHMPPSHPLLCIPLTYANPSHILGLLFQKTLLHNQANMVLE